jgi:DNA adenine methylase
MNTQSTMKAGLAVTKQTAQDIAAWLAARPETLRVVNVEQDAAYQAKDVDLVWETATQTYLVKIKNDQGGRTGSFFFETVRSREKGTPGCFLCSQADLLFYYFARTGRLYILPLVEARRWFLEHETGFESRETRTPAGEGEQGTTVGKLVPVERVLMEVKGAWHERLRAPQAKPFLKWAGGKTQLLSQLGARLPAGLTTGRINRYVEPFAGSGAVFFYLSRKFDLTERVLADQNPELVLAYRTIQAQVADVVAELSRLQTAYFQRGEAGRKDFYYQIRKEFNAARPRTDFQQVSAASVVRTARLIFLNRTCYNGLFRVNSRGSFNVPFGRYKNPRICDTDNLFEVSAALEGVQVLSGDFETCREYVKPGTFVYFDPPYRPLSRTASFNQYARGGFDDGDQERLAEFFRELDGLGAFLMLSNSDPHNEDPEDNFFQRLYAGFQINKVLANRMINSKGSKRGQITELLITNYE